jgi:hypothetical protein
MNYKLLTAFCKLVMVVIDLFCCGTSGEVHHLHSYTASFFIYNFCFRISFLDKSIIGSSYIDFVDIFSGIVDFYF